ncbi:hypothetical protein BFJ66_g17508 [Fusarium oxysporum f. sp. cepae]|nr:hypothetical protein BFJ67_g17427 [Fusarium oxysporum f. sp. cepae]RKK21606.1 hypothetical protein BFJ66_g17508 [Fusarium oxysporum f. sp. cepae]
MNYIPTDKQVADGLTKALPKDRFQLFRKALGVVGPDDGSLLPDYHIQRQLVQLTPTTARRPINGPAAWVAIPDQTKTQTSRKRRIEGFGGCTQWTEAEKAAAWIASPELDHGPWYC